MTHIVFASPKEYREAALILKNHQEKLYGAVHRVFEKIKSQRALDRLVSSEDADNCRFASKITVNDNGCWTWIGAQRSGYGVFWCKGKNRGAHRWSYNRFVKRVMKKYVICHKCDNPLCVNPAHLFQGTHNTNMRDASRKKRLSNKKLTDMQIAYILQSGESDQIMAEKFGVWDTTIRRVRRIGCKGCRNRSAN